MIVFSNFDVTLKDFFTLPIVVIT